MKKKWNHHSLAWATGFIMVITFSAFIVAEYPTWCHEQLSHSSSCGFWTWDFWNAATSKIMEAYNGEAWQIWATVIAVSVWALIGSAESRDSDDRMEAILKEVAHRVGMTDKDIEDATENSLEEARHSHPVWKFSYFAWVLALVGIAVIASVNVWP